MQNKLPNIRSNDGLFHNGNPATGSLGTIVDDVWLNDVQDSLQDFFDELNNVLALVGVQANPAKKTQVAEAIATLIGNVRRVADSNTRSLQNVIYNSKKSNAVDSVSSDTVATSFAAKTAHDKAVNALDIANSKLGPIGTYTGNTSSLYGQNIIFDVRDNNNLGLPSEAYPWGVGVSLSSSNGGKALLYIAHNASQVWAKGVYGTDDSQPWRRIDGTDWGTIRNPVYASTTLRGLAQYSDAIYLDSGDFAASSRAVKLLNDKKVDKLIEQTLDLTHLDSDKWYPVVLQMDSNNRRTYRFAIRTTLGESSATWGTHSVGFGVYLEWEAQPSGWGAWQGYDQMRVVHQFEVSHANQSPVLKMGQLYEISGEYVHLRGGAKYTLYRESGVSVTLTGTDYRWEFQLSDGNYRRQHLPVLTHYDESLVPKTSRQAIKDSINDEMVGQVAFFASSTPPSGWLKANGAAVSRTTYAALFACIGTRFGAGDGSTTFNLPDLRGEFVRGWDDGRNIDAGRALGSHQGDAIRNITGEIQAGIEEAQGNGSGAFRTKNFGRRGGTGSYGDDGFTFDASRVVPTAHENRPRNIALLACIKY